MPICTACGEKNPDNTPRCIKCGVALGHQARAKVDAQRATVAKTVRIIFTVIVVVLVLLAIKPAYEAAGTAYFRYRLNTVKEAAIKSCGGPITETSMGYQKDQFDKCMSTDETLQTAQTNFDNFTHASKS